MNRQPRNQGVDALALLERDDDEINDFLGSDDD